MTDRVTLLDVTTRDGLQDEPLFVATAEKARIVQALADAGITEVEATSFVHPKWVPQLADADVLIAQLPRGVRYATLIMNERGFDRAVAAFDGAGYQRGSYELCFVASASPRHNRSNNNRSIEETLAYFDTIAARAHDAGVTMRAGVACSFASPWNDETIEVDTVRTMASRFAAGGCAVVTLADTIGKGTPEVVSATIAAVQDATGVELSLHFHDLRGSALPNVEAGLARGVRRFEGVLGGIGGCPFAPEAPGNLDLEALARFVAARGYETGVDAAKLGAARRVLLAALAAAEPIVTEARA
jgi:hydroxymethylglutaryl-CoA lyase